MFLFKGALGAISYGASLVGLGTDPLDGLIKSVNVSGGFYQLVKGSRQMKFQQAQISFDKVTEGQDTKYMVHIQDKTSDSSEFFIPIHQEMEIKTFPTKKDKKSKVCYQWRLNRGNLDQIVGIIVDPQHQTRLSDVFGNCLRQTIDKNSKTDHLEFITQVSGLPVYKATESSNLSTTSKRQRLQQLNSILIRESNQKDTLLAFTGCLNYVYGIETKQVNPSIVFAIKSTGDFQFSIYVFTDEGYSFLQKPINSSMTYQVNREQSYIKWLDFSNGSKVVQVIFDKYDVVNNVKFTIVKCLFQINNRKSMGQVIEEDEANYLRQTLDEKPATFSPQIVQTYQKIDKVTFAPQHYDYTTESSKILDKYRDKRTMCQAKTAGCTLVTLANMLDLMVIDEDNKVKKAATTQLKTRNGVDIIPEKVLMHDRDTKALIQAQNNNLYYMDMNKFKIIEEFNPTNNQGGLNDIVPQKKLADLNQFNTFIGVSDNGIYRIDPRIGKTGVAEKHIYKGNYQFSKVCTTSDGNYTVGSADGTIRMYGNSVTSKSKATNKFPGYDRVENLDTTKDGKWILATFRSYLILLPTFSDQVSLYDKTIPISSRPRPIRLSVKMQHLQMCDQEDKSLIPARFDQSKSDSQKFIVSGFGPYVVIWPFNRVLRGDRDYTFLRAEDKLNEAQFKFDDSNKLILTTHSKVSMHKTIIK